MSKNTDNNDFPLWAYLLFAGVLVGGAVAIDGCRNRSAVNLAGYLQREVILPGGGYGVVIDIDGDKLVVLDMHQQRIRVSPESVRVDPTPRPRGY